jgi:hypothetical protein
VTGRLAIASGAVAVIFCVWAWRYTHHESALVQPTSFIPTLPPPPVAPPPSAPDIGDIGDVATQIAALPKTTSDSYAAEIAELEKVATKERASWSEDQQKQFDATVAELHHAIATADEGRSRHHAYRVLTRYLTRATSRDEVAFADTRATP